MPTTATTTKARGITSRVRHADTTATPYVVVFGLFSGITLVSASESADDARWRAVVSQANPEKVATYAAEIREKIKRGEAKPFRFSDL